MNEGQDAPVRRVGFCPHCGNRAPQRLLNTVRYFERTWRSADGEESDPTPWSSFVAVCETCGRILIYDNPGDSLTADEFNQGQLEFPTPGDLDVSVPERVAEIYSEGARIKEIAPNAFAVQIRRALEAICDDRNAAGRSLAQRLSGLVSKGELPGVFAQMTDIIRLLGNVGAHSAETSVHPLQVNAIDDFFKAVVEYIYVAPRKIAELEESLRRFDRSGRLQKCPPKS